MKKREIVKYCLDSLNKAGADKSTCSLSMTEKKELNVEIGEMTLFRTTFNTNLGITTIKNGKKGSVVINKTDKRSLDNAIHQAITMTKASQPDEAFDIAEYQPAKTFSKGSDTPNLNNMYNSLEEFVKYVKSTHPQIKLEQAIMDFTYSHSFFQNSNGVDFEICDGMYGFSPMFLSKDEKNTSSFNYTGFSALEIEKPLHHYGTIDTLLKQSVEQLNTKNINNKFVGTILVTPDCIGDFLGFIINDISDAKMISGNSLYKNKLNKQITNSKLTFHSKPISNEIADGYFITNDGYLAENVTIVEQGVLKTHLLGIYGSNKLGKKRSLNDGGAYIVDPGKSSYAKMIQNIDKGILLSRFSGGYPAANGDFSGVAKNSYYIENGEIKYPITETMVSGNANEMFNNLDNISKEQIDFGSAILPWIAFNGITIS